MKSTVRSEQNRAEEVTERAEKVLAQAKLIRRRADRDLLQVLKSVEELTVRAKTTKENRKSLWRAFKSVADFLRTLQDD
jgi:predicted transcriptional regulator